MAVKKTEKLSASLEDYLEAIFNLSSNAKVARSGQIAQELDVSKASVTGALRTLSQKGLVNYKPYGFVTLTDTGRVKAAAIAKKHDVIKSFFINILGVDKKTAQQAACKAEHALGPKIIDKLMHFTEFVNQPNKKGKTLAEEFERFCEKKA